MRDSNLRDVSLNDDGSALAPARSKYRPPDNIKMSQMADVLVVRQHPAQVGVVSRTGDPTSPVGPACR